MPHSGLQPDESIGDLPTPNLSVSGLTVAAAGCWLLMLLLLGKHPPLDRRRGVMRRALVVLSVASREKLNSGVQGLLPPPCPTQQISSTERHAHHKSFTLTMDFPPAGPPAPVAAGSWGGRASGWHMPGQPRMSHEDISDLIEASLLLRGGGPTSSRGQGTLTSF